MSLSKSLELFYKGKLTEAIGEQFQLVSAGSQTSAERLLLADLLLFGSRFEEAIQELKRIDLSLKGMREYVHYYLKLIKGLQQREALWIDQDPHFLTEPPSHLLLRLEAISAMRDTSSYWEITDLLDEADQDAPAITGHVDGRPFEEFRDGDELFATFLELIFNGEYYWLEWEAIQKIRIQHSESIRDLFLTPAILTLHNRDPLQIHLPTMYFGSDKGAEVYATGLETDWLDLHGATRGIGRRLLLIDDEYYTWKDFTQIEFRKVGSLTFQSLL